MVFERFDGQEKFKLEKCLGALHRRTGIWKKNGEVPERTIAGDSRWTLCIPLFPRRSVCRGAFLEKRSVCRGTFPDETFVQRIDSRLLEKGTGSRGAPQTFERPISIPDCEQSLFGFLSFDAPTHGEPGQRVSRWPANTNRILLLGRVGVGDAEVHCRSRVSHGTCYTGCALEECRLERTLNVVSAFEFPGRICSERTQSLRPSFSHSELVL